MEEKRSSVLRDYSETSSGIAQQKHEDKQSQQPDARQKIALSAAHEEQTKKANNAANKINSKKRQQLHQSAPKWSLFNWYKQRPKRSQLTILAVACASALLVGALLYTVWYMVMPTPPITVYQVGLEHNVPQEVSGFGPVATLQQSNVTFPAPGHVAQLLVSPGDQVKQNQPIIRLDPSQLQAQISLASNNVNARRNYLNAVSSATPYNPVIVAAAQQNYDVAQNQYHALIAQTNSSLHNSDIISQINGVVMQVSVVSGDAFNANQVLMVIANQSSVVVNAKLPLDVRQYVHNNDPAQVNALGLHNINLQGKITAIVPQVDPQTDSFTVAVTIANPDLSLWAGMNAYVHINSQVNAYVVPRISVLNPDQESSVYVLQKGKVYIRQVHVIGSSPDGNSLYIDSGLAANDQVVVLPLNRMHEGLSVTVGTVEH